MCPDQERKKGCRAAVSNWGQKHEKWQKKLKRFNLCTKLIECLVVSCTYILSIISCVNFQSGVRGFLITRMIF